jgi:hypothetical protein
MSLSFMCAYIFIQSAYVISNNLISKVSFLSNIHHFVNMAITNLPNSQSMKKKEYVFIFSHLLTLLLHSSLLLTFFSLLQFLSLFTMLGYDSKLPRIKLESQKGNDSNSLVNILPSRLPVKIVMMFTRKKN